MANKRMTDETFDRLFRQAVIDAFNEEINATPSSETLALTYTLSPEFENRITRLFEKTEKVSLVKKIMFYSKRVAILLVILIGLLITTMFLNTDVYAAISKILVEWYENFTSFIFEQDEVKDETVYERVEWLLEYIPDGYSQSKYEILGSFTNIEFTNSQGEILRYYFLPDTGSTNISVDNENHKIENAQILHNDAFFITALNDGLDNGIIWHMEDHIFYLWGQLSLEELVKIAESVSAEK